VDSIITFRCFVSVVATVIRVSASRALSNACHVAVTLRVTVKSVFGNGVRGGTKRVGVRVHPVSPHKRKIHKIAFIRRIFAKSFKRFCYPFTAGHAYGKTGLAGLSRGSR